MSIVPPSVQNVGRVREVPPPHWKASTTQLDRREARDCPMERPSATGLSPTTTVRQEERIKSNDPNPLSNRDVWEVGAHTYLRATGSVGRRTMK